MASQFRNRIVGAVVLVALAVIILPFIFDGKKSHYKSEFDAIPAIPLITQSSNLQEQVSTTTNKRDVVRNNTENRTHGPLEPTNTNSPAGTLLKREGDPKASAYVIQLKPHPTKVEELKAKLAFANYTVFTLPFNTEQGQATRIFIGPEISEQKLREMLPAIKELTGLEGTIKEYKVSNNG